MAPRVSLRYAENNRQIKRTADSSYFNPQNCVVVLSFESVEEIPTKSADGTPDGELSEIVLSLRSAEKNPKFREFVALKLFRDQFLSDTSYRWAQTPEGRDRVLRSAIEQGLILRHQVPNPKSPEHPVTAIRVNNAHPTVEALLKATQAERSPFRPVPIRGDELSATVIAERR
jgi:hypothetical protein